MAKKTLMVNSMTGFAARNGAGAGWTWAWDIRSVNARGLDVRMRLSETVEGLEQSLRTTIAAVVTRGNLSVALKLQPDAASEDDGLDTARLETVVGQLARIEHMAETQGLTLAPPSAAEVLNVRGVLNNGSRDIDHKALRSALEDSFAPMLEDFLEMRAAEGAALAKVLDEQLDRIASLTDAAESAAGARAARMRDSLQANLAGVLGATDAIDEARVAQELALIAVKADVTEELDRLRAHVAAARDLVAGGGAIGRKLDFLMQEFNREANTLCAKAQSAELTGIGLDLKAVIDQMREQVQNVE